MVFLSSLRKTKFIEVNDNRVTVTRCGTVFSEDEIQEVIDNVEQISRTTRDDSVIVDLTKTEIITSAAMLMIVNASEVVKKHSKSLVFIVRPSHYRHLIASGVCDIADVLIRNGE